MKGTEDIRRLAYPEQAHIEKLRLGAIRKKEFVYKCFSSRLVINSPDDVEFGLTVIIGSLTAASRALLSYRSETNPSSDLRPLLLALLSPPQ
jgi:hypothetical protein